MSVRVVLPVIAGVLLALIVGLASSADSIPASINHRVIISGFEFIPSQLKVSLGDTVTWVNKDIVPHNIAINTQQKALSPELEKDETFVFKVTNNLSYICGFHPSMKGKIIIDR